MVGRLAVDLLLAEGARLDLHRLTTLPTYTLTS
jgi:hypothetical protein